MTPEILNQYKQKLGMISFIDSEGNRRSIEELVNWGLEMIKPVKLVPSPLTEEEIEDIRREEGEDGNPN